MGVTPDRTPGPSLEEELQLEDRTADGDPSVEGAIRYLNGDFRGVTSTGVKSLTTGSGMSAGEHRALDQLVHDIAEASWEEIVYDGNRVSDIITWTDSGKTKKIREVNVTYSGNQVATIVTKQYDGDGNLITGETLTETPTYSGGKITALTRTLT